jgi:hypothetical protein
VNLFAKPSLELVSGNHKTSERMHLSPAEFIATEQLKRRYLFRHQLKPTHQVSFTFHGFTQTPAS